MRRRQRRSRPPDKLIGFVDVRIGPPIDTFGGAGGESKARLFEVFGYAFLAQTEIKELSPRFLSRSRGQLLMRTQGRCSSANTCRVG